MAWIGEVVTIHPAYPRWKTITKGNAALIYGHNGADRALVEVVTPKGTHRKVAVPLGDAIAIRDDAEPFLIVGKGEPIPRWLR